MLLLISGDSSTDDRCRQYKTTIDEAKRAALQRIIDINFIHPASTTICYVLRQDEQANGSYELTSSQVFDGEGIATLITKAPGRSIEEVDEPFDEFSIYFSSMQLPEFHH